MFSKIFLKFKISQIFSFFFAFKTNIFRREYVLEYSYNLVSFKA